MIHFLYALPDVVILLLAFVIIVDHPFRGETSVSSADIASALALNARRH